MAQKNSFPAGSCSSCPFYVLAGASLVQSRYCKGRKGRKPKPFRKSDPYTKAPKWCPRRLATPVCRVYTYKSPEDEQMEWFLHKETSMQNSNYISVIKSRYITAKEFPAHMTAKQFYEATEQEPIASIIPDYAFKFGEIIEIDDGIKPYAFYYRDYATVIPVLSF